MKNYEIMVIVKNNLDKTAAEKVCNDAVVKRIENAGGKTTFTDFWGERGFAYKIKQMTWGYYFVARFEIDGSALAEIKKELNIENDLVRFLITSVDKNTTEPRKYADMKSEYEAQEKELMKAKEEVKEKKVAKNTKPAKLTTVKDKVNAEGRENALGQEPKKEEKAVDKDELDKKLDDIVSESAQNL